MQFHDAQINHSPHASQSVGTVPGLSRLHSVAQNYDLDGLDYLIVENDRGQPIGVVSTNRIRTVLNADHDRERQRWESMPIESVMDARMTYCESSGPNTEIETLIDCQAVRVDGDLFAVTTRDDVFVSWKTVEKTLQFALVDPVTSLPNRSVFNNHLHAECNRSQRTKNSVAVIMIDIDYFKRINDDFGHAAGDTILRLVSQCVRLNLRSYDLVARYGGDELAVICSGCRPNEIEIAIKRLQAGVAQLVDHEDLPCPPPTLSIGACVVHSPAAMNDPASMIAAADECLYQAKQAGRNCSFSTEIGEPEPPESPKTAAPDPITAWQQLKDSNLLPPKQRRTD